MVIYKIVVIMNPIKFSENQEPEVDIPVMPAPGTTSIDPKIQDGRNRGG